MLGYRWPGPYAPRGIYYGDSYAYLWLALDPKPSQGFRNIGYPLLLWLLAPFHSISVVVIIQHLLGLAIGLMIYSVLRRRAVPVWGALLATVPALFDAHMLELEHVVMSDTLFIFLVVAAFVTLMWSPGDLSAHAAAGAGLLLAFAALTRSVGVPLLLLVLVSVALRRIGWRRFAVVAITGLLPLALYASWYRADHGKFTLTGEADGVSLWARTMTFADCRLIQPPPDEAALCPNGSWHDAASEYVWASDSSLTRLPGGAATNNDRARSFALHAIMAQPLDYLSAVTHDLCLAFHWTPARHPQRLTPAFDFKNGSWEPQGVTPWARQALAAYAPGTSLTYHSVEPYAGFLRAYQYAAYLRGPFLAAILLAGMLALRRGALLPWAAALCLLVLPVAALDFDLRYVLPVVPVACLAAAMAISDRQRVRRAFVGAAGLLDRL